MSVILMQRTVDSTAYIGKPAGRPSGYRRQQGLKIPDPHHIFGQRHKARTDKWLPAAVPQDSSTGKRTERHAGDLDHSWTVHHRARTNRLWNTGVGQDDQTNGHFTTQPTSRPICPGRRVTTGSQG